MQSFSFKGSGKIKILQVTNFFKPSFEAGGVARVAYDLSKSLRDANHDVTVFTTNRSKNNINVKANIPLNIEGMTVYYFENLRKYFSLKMIPIPYYMPIVAQKYISNFDVIHIHEHRTLSAAIVHYYAKKYGVPYVLQSHGSVLPFLQQQKFKKAFDFLVGNSILKNATKVIALNEDEASQYQKMGIYEQKIEIIPNGINLDEYKNVPPKGNFKAKYKISENDKIILYVGRVHKNKGIDLLIRAMPLLLKKIPNIQLVIIGPDDGFQYELENLAKMLLIEKKVIFTGFVETDIKMAAFTDADVFVTPIYSGFPISFLEACVFGLPIITTFKADNLNWINNNVGYVVEYDKNEFATALVDILTNSEMASLFSENAKNLSNTTFSLEHTVNRIELIYLSIIKTSVDN